MLVSICLAGSPVKLAESNTTHSLKQGPISSVNDRQSTDVPNASGRVAMHDPFGTPDLAVASVVPLCLSVCRGAGSKHPLRRGCERECPTRIVCR